MSESEITIEVSPSSKSEYIQMITNISLTISLLLIFTMKILKFIFYKKKYNLKHQKLLSRSNSSSV